MNSLLNEILADASQGSDMWNKIRLGKFTSSEIHRLIHKKGALTEANKKYIFEKVAEILTGEAKTFFENDAMRWGTQQEPIARDLFAEQTGLEITECGFILVDEYYGGSPDGLISDYGLIEIKCPSSAVHIQNCTIKSQEDLKAISEEYYFQIQSNMIVTERDHAFFISYDPRVTQMPLFTIMIKRDEEAMTLIKKCIEAGKNELQRILSVLK